MASAAACQLSSPAASAELCCQNAGVERLANHPGRRHHHRVRIAATAVGKARGSRSRPPCRQRPVKALALPALTRMARVPMKSEAAGDSDHRRGRRVGAGEDIPATAMLSASISSMSSRLRYFISDAAVARVTPAIIGGGGKLSGASGETVIAGLSPRTAPRQPPRHNCGFRWQRRQQHLTTRAKPGVTDWRHLPAICSRLGAGSTSLSLTWITCQPNCVCTGSAE